MKSRGHFWRDICNLSKAHKRPILSRFILSLLIIYLFIALPFSFIVTVNVFGPYLDIALNKTTNFLIDHMSESTKFEYGSFVAPYIALILGGAAFGLRTRKIWVYALLELTIGVYGAGVSLLALYSPNRLPDTPTFRKLSSLDNSYSVYIGLASALFIIVRGLDNLYSYYKRKYEGQFVQPPPAEPNDLDYLIQVSIRKQSSQL